MNCFLELHLLAMDPYTSLQAEDIYYPDPVITDGKPSPLQEEEEEEDTII